MMRIKGEVTSHLLLLNRPHSHSDFAYSCVVRLRANENESALKDRER